MEGSSSGSVSGKDEGVMALLKGDIVFENVWFKYPISKDRLAELNRNSNSNDADSDFNDQQDRLADIELTDEISEESKQNIKQRENVLSNLSFEIKKG